MRYLILFIMLPYSCLFADQTGNLVINGNFENGNSNNWTTSGEVQVLNDCCGSNYDLEFGLSGSIEQDFNLTSDTINQSMLNNGITLNSSVLVQNGECNVNGCWGGQGNADSFSIRLQIKDSDNNILATTTQERYNVTDINGEVFENNISYSGIDSNIGNIFISGTDSNGVAGGLGGANIDNVSVIMTYEPTVLTVSQTSQISTTIQGLEEVLSSNVETIEFIPVEEYSFEIFEEPELVVQTFEKIYFEPIAKEEINTGTVNVFQEIPLEVAYEESTTIETFTTEIQGFEERTETTEVASSTETESPGKTQTTEETESVESSGTNETAQQNSEPTGNSEQVSASNERATTTESTEESSTDSEQESNEVAVDNRDIDSESENDSSSNQETNTESNPIITVAEITEKVNKATRRISDRLISTNFLVANAMQSNVSLDDYGNINSKMFENLLDYKSEIPYSYQKDYLDNRNIYEDKQNRYNDVVARYQKKIDDAKAKEIKAQLELEKIINGY